jgi:hypothetical protein
MPERITKEVRRRTRVVGGPRWSERVDAGSSQAYGALADRN